MKIKNILIALLALLLVFSMAACNTTGDGEGSSTPESSEPMYESKRPDYDFMTEDLSKYITLGQYKGLEIEIDPLYEVTDEDVEAQIIIDLVKSELYDEIKDRDVRKIDVVNIDFEGFIDGVAFSGGSAKDQVLTIYNGGGYIPGFADGVIGATPGTTVDVPVTFPEDYHSADYAGKEAVFKITVNYIYEAKELTGEVVKSLTGEEMTADELFADYKQKMTESNQETYDEYKLSLVWEIIFDSVTVISLPEDLVDYYYQSDVDYYKMYANLYGVDYEEFLENYVGTTDAELYEYAKDVVLSEIVVYALIREENITVSEEEYNAMLNEWAEEGGYEVEDILDSYSKEELMEMFAMSKLYDEGVSWQTYIEKAE